MDLIAPLHDSAGLVLALQSALTGGAALNPGPASPLSGVAYQPVLGVSAHRSLFPGPASFTPQAYAPDLIVGGASGSAPVSPGYLRTASRRKMETTMHSAVNFEFDTKDPEERVRVGFDFGALVSSILESPAPVVTSALQSGTADATPSAVLDGTFSVVGARVLQWVHGGLDSANYRLRCKAYGPNGELLVLVGILPVKTA